MKAKEAIGVDKLKEQMTGLPKLELIQKEDHTRVHGVLVFEDARLKFWWWTGMLDTRANIGCRYPGKTCPHCKDGREDGAMEIRRHCLT